MIIRIVKMVFMPEKAESFKYFFETVRGMIEEVDGCTHLELYRDVELTNQFFTYSHWISEDYLNQYRESDLFREVWGETKKMFQSKPLAWSVERIVNEDG